MATNAQAKGMADRIASLTASLERVKAERDLLLKSNAGFSIDNKKLEAQRDRLAKAVERLLHEREIHGNKMCSSRCKDNDCRYCEARAALAEVPR